MRNLKRVLALAMAMVLMLGMMVIGASAASYADADQIDADYAEAVAVLTGMGVFKGQTAGFAPKAILTRAEAATLIYRAITGDVTDSKVDLYDYPVFDDMAKDAWYIGYVTYAANDKLIVGDGKGNFMPDDDVTGVQVLKIMLGALGYGQNGEFEGAGWKDHVLTTADDLGLLDNIANVNLDKGATREVVAQILFDAIQARTTTYTPAFGYVNTPLTSAASIGAKVFTLAKATKTDEWGRPYYGWTYKTGDKATYFVEDHVTYTTAVTECQIATDKGLKTSKTYDVYTNGASNKSYYTVDPLDTRYGVGAQGRITEVYADRIVMIDTYLAEVLTVVPARYDAAGHTIIEASNGLHVYNQTGANTTNVRATDVNYSISGNKYAVGDMMLISIVEKDGQYVATKYIDRDLADSIVGNQTVLFSALPQHVVNDVTYNDAAELLLDQAGKETASHTWYFDQYDNLIGVTDIATVYDYGTIKNIQWINPVGTSGYAQATVTLMDGTDKSMTIDKIIYGATEWDLTYWNAYNMQAPNNGSISTNIAENYVNYAAKHLYRIESNPDGSVNMVAVEAITAPKAIGAEIKGADVKTNVSTITNGTDTIYTNNNTQYLVRVATKDANVYTFSAVTGYTNIGNYTGNDVVVDYVDLNGDKFAEYVYVIGTPDAASNKGLFYLTDSNVKTVLKGANAVDYYVLTGYVDGVLGTIQVPGDKADVVNAIVNAGINKMATVEYKNGQVIAATAGIVDFTNLTSLGGSYVNKNLSSQLLTPNTLGASSTVTTTNATAVLSGGVLKATKGGYTSAFNMSEAVVIGGTLNEGVINDKALYVIYKTVGVEDYALYVYVADYGIANPGVGSVTKYEWVTDGAYEYCLAAKKIVTTSVTETLGTLQTKYGQVYYTIGGSTYALSSYDNMNNMTIAAALAGGYQINVANQYAYWTVSNAK